MGLVLLGVGIAASAYGAATSDSGNGALWIAASAVVSVLGMILVVPVVVSAVARGAGRLPLTARYAARDAARHRTRTVPAVAAVAATVAGVVALGIANASDEKQNEMTYQPQAALGSGYVSWAPEALAGEELPDRAEGWSSIEAAVRRVAPEVEVREVRGPDDTSDPNGYTTTWVEGPRDVEADECCLSTWGPMVSVADSASELGIAGDAAARIDAALGAGRAVMLTLRTEGPADITIRRETWLETAQEAESIQTDLVPAELVPWDEAWGPAPSSTIIPTTMADEVGLEVATTSLRLTGDVDEATQTRMQEAAAGAVEGALVYIERGYERPDEALIILLVLGALGGVLMLGGTLTATFLALSDARPDLATLSAVGAAPRARRRVAAAYALVIGFVGAVLGAGVGFIPGIAISRPLTASFGAPDIAPNGPFLAIPWLLIGAIVLALPLLTAAVVGLTARSRLPLVARLD